MSGTIFSEKRILEALSDPIKIAEAIYSITKEMKKQSDFSNRIECSAQGVPKYEECDNEYNDNYDHCESSESG